jgi:sterol desaturase/sphingolipid hydroxylase (fatty acid hydroxylase superfamily)
MVSVSSTIIEIWHHLAWVCALAVMLAIAEYRWPAGRHPTFAARFLNVLIVTFVMVLLAFVNPVAIPVYDWLARNGLIGMAFGNWHPQGTGGQMAASLVYVLVWDVFQYWFHRAEHTFTFLWPVHALHHDEENLNSTTSQRNTVWSAVFQFFLVNVPTLMVCGFDLLSLVGAYLFFKIYGFFNHANIRLNLGRLTPVISGPQWHRLHHGRDSEYFNKNFAAFFPFIDILFGTYRRPAPDEYPASGLSDQGPAPLGMIQLVRDVLGILQPARKQGGYLPDSQNGTGV